MAAAWHSYSTARTLAELSTSAAGLAEDAVGDRRAKHGENVLPERPSRSLATVFFAQFQNPLIYLLLGAAVVSFAIGHASDAAVIAAVVVINAVIGAFQEGRAERALAALRRIGAHPVRVRRDRREVVIDARACRVT